MSEARRPFWIGALAGVVIAAIATPAAVLFWKTYAADRDTTRSQLAQLAQHLEQNNQAMAEMRKAASLAGVTRQLEELNGRIKNANEALTELQKTSASIQRASLDRIADRLDHMDADLKANADAVAAVQKSAPLANLGKQIGQVQANLTALEMTLAELRKTTAAADTGKRFDAIETALIELKKTNVPSETAKRFDAIEASLASLKESMPAPALSGALDDIKKGLDQAKQRHAGMDLVVIHAEPPAVARSAQASLAPTASAAMAPLGFEFKRIGASEDKAQTDAVVAKVKDVLKGRSNCAISVAGYADTVGDDEFNLDLSKNRAHAVALRLREALGEKVQIAETGWGARRLQVWTPPNTPRPENRRVDIAVHCAS
jgi:outer membrane protein OmpA-like peptidoglycan-associated protein